MRLVCIQVGWVELGMVVAYRLQQVLGMCHTQVDNKLMDATIGRVLW